MIGHLTKDLEERTVSCAAMWEEHCGPREQRAEAPMQEETGLLQ